MNACFQLVEKAKDAGLYGIADVFFAKLFDGFRTCKLNFEIETSFSEANSGAWTPADMTDYDILWVVGAIEACIPLRLVSKKAVDVVWETQPKIRETIEHDREVRASSFSESDFAQSALEVAAARQYRQAVNRWLVVENIWEQEVREDIEFFLDLLESTETDQQIVESWTFK